MNDLIDHIYDCATDVSLWPDVLRTIMGQIGADKAVLCCNNEETLIWAAPVGLGPNYTDHVYHLREIDDFHAMRRLLPVGKALLSHELISLEDFRKTEFYAQWAKPNDCVHVCGGLLAINETEWTALRFFRPERKPPFESKAKSILESLIPHMSRAIGISRHLSYAEQRLRQYEGVFGLLTSGLLLLNGQKQLVFQNRAAETILGRRDPLSIVNGRPTIRDRSSHKGFDALLDQTLSTDGTAWRGGVRLLPHVDHDRRPIQAWIAPITRAPDAFEWMRECAEIACFLVDPSHEEPLPKQVFEQLYELTPSEAALVHNLLSGETLNEIAATAGRSINTLKTHLRSIFMKTDTARQQELISLLMPLTEYRGSSGKANGHGINNV